MIAKLSSPLSPALAATTLTAQLRNRVPTQLRRSLPLYAVCALVIVTLFHFHVLGTHAPTAAGQLLARPSMPFVSSSLSSSSLSSSSSSSSSSSAYASAAKLRPDFPPKIWQTWKVAPIDFEERDRSVARSWLDKNPNYRYEVLTDSNEMRYVEYHYGPAGFNRPDIVHFFGQVRAAIVKSDLLRYLVMYAEGGTYADIDVEALRPIDKFIPDRFDANDIDLVVGVEIDEPDWKDHPILGPKSRSFCQWTFMGKPQLPIMMLLIEQIMAWLTKVAERQSVPISEVELDFDDIISGTGPSAFTNAIMADMNAHRHEGSPVITWDTFHDMRESQLVNRVLVLTIEAFAASQGHSDSGTHDSRAALVRHHYHASNWPSRHPRYNHPVYGSVEKCNWEDDCVHHWDKLVEQFKTLDEAEQKRLIAEREHEVEQYNAEQDAERAKQDEERRREEDKEKEAECRKTLDELEQARKKQE